MKAVLKIEFQRLFRSVTFYISLGIGLILTMTQFVMVGLQESMHILDAYSPKGISEPSGVFSSYFGMAGPPLVYRQIYYLILPILAVFAYATTFCADHNSGYVKNLYTRTNKKYYYAAKYIVSCTAGGLDNSACCESDCQYDGASVFKTGGSAGVLCSERNCAVGRYFLHTPVHIYGIVPDINFFLSVYFCFPGIVIVNMGQ